MSWEIDKGEDDNGKEIPREYLWASKVQYPKAQNSHSVSHLHGSKRQSLFHFFICFMRRLSLEEKQRHNKEL